MDIFLQGVGICSISLIGFRFGKVFYPHLFKKNLSLLKTRYNPNGDSFALITGSSDGIGKEFAKVLAKQNMNIILHGRNLEKLKNAREEILNENANLQQNNIKVEIFECDLQQENIKVEEQIKNGLEKYNIQLVINNAGVTNVDKAENVKLNEINTLINVNAISPIILSQYLLNNKFTQSINEYAILNVGTLTSFYPIGYIALYSGSKGFFHTYSQALQQETNQNIQVTSVTPYYISTKMTRFQKISFETISTNEFVLSSLNSLLYKQATSCGSWKHELIQMYFNILPKQQLSQKLTKNMENVANQLNKIKQIQLLRDKSRSKRNIQSNSDQTNK